MTSDVRPAAGDRSKPVVIFDGSCAFCIRWLGRLRRWDQDDAFEYLPLQDPSVETRFPALSGDELRWAMHLVEPDGTVSAGADAVERILNRVPRGRLLGWLFHLPLARPIARRVYRWVADNRAELGCGRHCGVGGG